jgi:hypothetical protein
MDGARVHDLMGPMAQPVRGMLTSRQPIDPQHNQRGGRMLGRGWRNRYGNSSMKQGVSRYTQQTAGRQLEARNSWVLGMWLTRDKTCLA